MKSFMTPQARVQTRGPPAVCCTHSSSSLHQEQRQHLDHSGSSCQLLFQLQHKPPNPDTHPISPVELPSSLLHPQVHSESVRQKSLMGKRSSHMTQLCVVADTSTHTFSLTKPNSCSTQSSLGVRFYFQWLLFLSFLGLLYTALLHS